MLLFHEMADSHQKGTQTSPSIRNAAFLFFLHPPGASPGSVEKTKGIGT
jgi:hypothetical protein